MVIDGSISRTIHEWKVRLRPLGTNILWGVRRAQAAAGAEGGWGVGQMRPIDLIKGDLGEDVWRACSSRTPCSGEIRPAGELSPFSTSKTYVIHGRTKQFDFPTLPGGSYCVYDANGKRAIRLTREGKEIESVLGENWLLLPKCDPVILSGLVLMFFDGGILSTHRVLLNAESLLSNERGYLINEKEFVKAEPLIDSTKFVAEDGLLTIRAVTLTGWMHDKQNLGIEHIHISRSGDVQLDARKVLSKKIFKSVPSIRY